MNTYQVRLQKREEIAGGTMAFHFEKPAGFRFKPGQAIDVILTEESDPGNQAARHTFSLVNAPFQDELVVATRIRNSPFKNALRSISLGSRVNIAGPFGSLTLHNDHARPAVFIAGGIGITPYMSILRQAAQDQSRQRLLLLYSNRRPEEAAFLGELQQLEQQNKNFRLIATMTGMGESNRSWEGKRRMIDEEMVKSAATGLSAPIYYLAGPPLMVEAMRQTLERMRISDDDIRSEEFYGY